MRKEYNMAVKVDGIAEENFAKTKFKDLPRADKRRTVEAKKHLESMLGYKTKLVLFQVERSDKDITTAYLVVA